MAIKTDSLETVSVQNEQATKIERILKETLLDININNFLTQEEQEEIIESGDLFKDKLKEEILTLFKSYQYFGDVITFDLTVPAEYIHDEQIDCTIAKEKERTSKSGSNSDFTSNNFSRAINKLQPGKVYTVKMSEILRPITSEKCLELLQKQKAILVGGQGLTLALDLHKEKFPENTFVMSFDEKHTLWKDSNGYYYVPTTMRKVEKNNITYFIFPLSNFNRKWVDGRYLLSFHEKEFS